MYYNCSKLTSIDVSKFNTEKVENMKDIFNNCSKLTTIDVSNSNKDDIIKEINESKTKLNIKK